MGSALTLTQPQAFSWQIPLEALRAEPRSFPPPPWSGYGTRLPLAGVLHAAPEYHLARDGA